MIENGVDGIEAYCVEVIIRNPFQRVRYKEMTNLITIHVIEVHRGSPRCLVPLGEVRCEVRKVIAFRSKVVVNNIQNNGQPTLVACVYKLLQPMRSTV